MTYKQTLDYLFSQLPMYQRQGALAMKKNLYNIKYLCNELDNPEQKFPSIHIAGTNGKGTSSHILSSLLQQKGFTVGLYTSPHYKDFRERIKINAEYITEQKVIDFTKDIKDRIHDITPSFFEISVAMAFDYFAKQEVDIAIVETGLGGRLDSTNVILPKLSVITNIGYDHMNMLGDTLLEIAGEKAGIIKQTIPVVIGEYQESVQDVFMKTAKQKKSPLFFSRDICQVRLLATDSIQSTYHVTIYDELKFEVSIPLNGPFQTHNIQTAIASYVTFLGSKSRLDETQIAQGLTDIIKNTKYQGRWQIQSEEPLVILDSAHNIDGINYITKELDKLNKPLHLVLGFVRDKNWKELLAKFPKHSQYYFCTPRIPRGLPTSELQVFALDQKLEAKLFESVSEAKRTAIENAANDECVFIGGSTFVVAEAL